MPEPEPSLFEDTGTRRPLADRLRPQRFDDLLGQDHILAAGKPLREAIERGAVTSTVFWGPPGSGKTTLAYLIAKHTDRKFEPFSAVTEGVPRVREIIKQAQDRTRLEGRATILFCDEIHRFNKSQQDAFLPWVEQGVITLIGATTENPSFELTPQLLSRVRVFVLKPLEPQSIRAIVERAIAQELGIVGARQVIGEEAMELLVRTSDGDARQALNTLEAALEHLGYYGARYAERGAQSPPPALSIPDHGAPSLNPPVVDGEGPRTAHRARLTREVLEAVLSRRLPRYDKAGEEHFNLISAFQKAVRGSDVEGSLYWLARMIAGGEDPLYVARRIVRIASEDVGLADPRALTVALAAKDAFHFLGSPEGELALAEATVYLATSPKSNRVLEAWGQAVSAAEEHPSEPVPLHIRNAPTALMKELGYGKEYRYDHAEADGVAAGQEYLPDVLRGAKWYNPTDRGFEKTVAERVQWWEGMKQQVRGDA